MSYVLESKWLVVFVNDTYYYHMWNPSHTLCALMYWYKTKPTSRTYLKALIERMITGLDRLATVRGTDEKWGDYAAFTSDAYFDDQPVEDGDQGVQLRGVLSGEPLVQWAEMTGDATALDLAWLFSNGVLTSSRVGMPRNTNEADIKPDDSFDGDLQSKTATAMVRISSRVQPVNIEIMLNDRSFSTVDRLNVSGRFAVLNDCPSGAVVTINFPVEKRTAIEYMGERNRLWNGLGIM